MTPDELPAALSRTCPACRLKLEDDRPFLCSRCWDLLPATKRRALTVAWRRRGSRPAERDCQLEGAVKLVKLSLAAQSARTDDAPDGNSPTRGELD